MVGGHSGHVWDQVGRFQQKRGRRDCAESIAHTVILLIFPQARTHASTRAQAHARVGGWVGGGGGKGGKASRVEGWGVQGGKGQLVIAKL